MVRVQPGPRGGPAPLVGDAFAGEGEAGIEPIDFALATGELVWLDEGEFLEGRWVCPTGGSMATRPPTARVCSCEINGAASDSPSTATPDRHGRRDQRPTHAPPGTGQPKHRLGNSLNPSPPSRPPHTTFRRLPCGSTEDARGPPTANHLATASHCGASANSKGLGITRHIRRYRAIARTGTGRGMCRWSVRARRGRSRSLAD